MFIEFNVSFLQEIPWVKPLVLGTFWCIELTTDPGFKNTYRLTEKHNLKSKLKSKQTTWTST